MNRGNKIKNSTGEKQNLKRWSYQIKNKALKYAVYMRHLQQMGTDITWNVAKVILRGDLEEKVL